MTDALILLCTCSSREEATRLATTLVEERLAACVNILATPIQSVYRWQGAVEQAEEYLLLMKTTQARSAELEKRVAALHSYDTPEIIALPIVGGSEKYLAWLREQVY